MADITLATRLLSKCSQHLVAAVQQHPHHNVQPARRKVTLAKPACTHVRMGITHVTSLDQVCQVCGRVPRTGTLYYCQEDDLGDYLKTVSQSSSKDDPDFVREMIELGMSSSVIHFARRGFYTPEQVDKLTKQRQKVLNAIGQGGARQNAPVPTTPRGEKTALAENDTPAKPGDGTPRAIQESRGNHHSPLTRVLESFVRKRHERCMLRCCHVRSNVKYCFRLRTNNYVGLPPILVSTSPPLNQRRLGGRWLLGRLVRTQLISKQLQPPSLQRESHEANRPSHASGNGR
jgi:hypothetical protein